MNPAALFEEGVRLQQQGALAGAADRYAQVLRLEPGHADALYRLAQVSCQQEQFEAGIDLARRALATDPRRARAHLLIGMALLRLGRRQEALASFDRAIATAPELADAHGNRGDVLVELGRHAEAIASYDRALGIQPHSPENWCNRGAALFDLGRYQEALASYQRAVAIAPQFAEAHFNCGNVLVALARHADAVASYDVALALKPDDPAALNNKGNALRQLRRCDEAVACFDKVLANMPAHAGALMGRGVALIELGRRGEALRCFEALLAVTPDHVDALNNRGFVLNALNRRDEALACYERALALDPAHVEALINRGAALADLGLPAEALKSYDHALRLAPDHAAALCNRAKALNALGRYGEALSSLERALTVKPDHVEALFTRGSTLSKLDRFDAAIGCFEQVLAIKPDHVHAEATLVSCCLSICDWDRLARVEPKLNEGIAAGRSILSPHILLQLSVDASDALACTERFVAREIPLAPPLPPVRPAARSERIRLAYLSGDFRRHPVAYLIPGLLEQHDRSRFEVIGISFGPDDRSKIRARIVGAFDRFHDVRSQSDGEVASLLRDLGVDIAVDLSGHTEMSRSSILSCRPAPIQVSYLGLLGTMGADFIDYVIADQIVLPFDRQPFYTEKIVHLPDCFIVCDGRTETAPRSPSRSEAGLPREGFVFASFNASYKFREPVFAVWMKLLRSVEGSVLWLLASNEPAVANLRRQAQQRGVDPARLVFAPRTELADHLARQELAHLFLDTLPYNAGATAVAALWAGLPILTMRGEGWVGRMAASMLNAAGLPELVTTSLADYEALALKLATDPRLMASVRGKLVQNRMTHPLFDTDRFRRHIEAAYSTMWERWRRGETPVSFRVDPLVPGQPVN